MLQDVAVFSYQSTSGIQSSGTFHKKPLRSPKCCFAEYWKTCLFCLGTEGYFRLLVLLHDAFNLIGCRQRHSLMKCFEKLYEVYYPMDALNKGPGGGGNLSFQDTGLCHSHRKSTTHKSGEISEKYTHKSGKFTENHTHKSGNAEKVNQQMNFYKKPYP